jgi:predicted AAA+ superfamily ATPase
LRRKLIDKLLVWKEDSNRKVLMLYGASGVGKTYLALDFAKSFYEQFIYFDLEKDSSVIDNILENDKNEFELSLDWYQDLSILDSDSNDIQSDLLDSNKSKEILLIFDNIQLFLLEESLEHEKHGNSQSNETESSKKEKLKEVFDLLNQSSKYHVIGISSELINEFKPSNHICNQLLHPLDFEEFLYSTGCEWYIETIKVHYQTNSKLPDIVHNQLLKLFETYLEIGGMPLAISEYNNIEGLYNISNQHKLIMNSYLYEINKRINVDGLKINQVFWSMDKQLLKDNRKFQFNMIRKGATSAMYNSAIDYIDNTFYCLKCSKLEWSQNDKMIKEQMDYIESLYNSKDNNLLNVKLYHFDVGLLNTSLNRNETKVDFDSLNRNKDLTPLALNKLFHMNKRRALFENYIAITLASNGYSLMYWESNSLAKIEFIIVKKGEVIPIEVRPNEVTRSKNFSVFKNQHKNVNEQIKISTKNFEYNNHVKYIPIYAAFCI